MTKAKKGNRNMSKAEEYIIEHTSVLKDSNGKEYFKWLSPDQARKAVEIARDETINDMCDWIVSGLDVNEDGILTVNVKEFVKDIKQAMKDET